MRRLFQFIVLLVLALLVNSIDPKSSTVMQLKHRKLPSIRRSIGYDGASNHRSVDSLIVAENSVPPTQSIGVLKYLQLRFEKYNEQLKEDIRMKLPMVKYMWPLDSTYLQVCLWGSLVFMMLGKWFNMKVPFILKKAVDSLSDEASIRAMSSESMKLFGVPLPYLTPISYLLLSYGMARALYVICSEIKTTMFTQVSQNILRKFSVDSFTHLHSLDNDFFLKTPSGAISMAYARAVRGFQTMLFQLVFSVLPALVELFMVTSVLYRQFSTVFAAIVMCTFSLYLVYTVYLTQWKINIRKRLVEVDYQRSGTLTDSILNHEVIKLFTNEKFEIAQYDGFLAKAQKLNIEATVAIAALNFGQSAIFCVGLVSSLLVALSKVQQGEMSVGDLIAVNSMLLQLSIPFNFMGYTYQEIRQSLVDMEYMSRVITTPATIAKAQIDRSKTSNPLPSIDALVPRNGPSTLEFRNVSFKYKNEVKKNKAGMSQLSPTGNSEGYLLQDISFKIEKGQSVAIVGPSGSGKSTILKLITHMLEPQEGAVLIDNVSLQDVTTESVRQRVSVIPQDTCLFDKSVLYNIQYGSANASPQEIEAAIVKSNLVETIKKMSDGLNTVVGERGARLSGGERQKVSIARAILKNPSLILCDEITSSVDSIAEREIISSLRSATSSRTTITVAHRLTSIVHSDKILVLSKGRIVEQGRHEELIKKPNGVYRGMWITQQNSHVFAPDSDEPPSDSSAATENANDLEEESINNSSPTVMLSNHPEKGVQVSSG